MYRKLSFTPTFWTFTFSYAVVISYILRWLGLTQPNGALYLSFILVSVITLFIGSIALRSLIALRQGKFLATPSLS